MDPKAALAHINEAPNEQERMRRALEYLSEDYQWSPRVDKSIRWGWFSGAPAEIAKAGLGIS